MRTIYKLTMDDIKQIALDKGAKADDLTPEKLRTISNGVTCYFSEALPECVEALI